jgi:hypothetical protein
MSSRQATISKSVSIAASDLSRRLFLLSTKAKSLHRSFSKSSSRSKVISTSGFSFEEKLSGHGARNLANGRARWFSFVRNLMISLSPARFPGMVKIDHFRRNSGALPVARAMLGSGFRVGNGTRAPIVVPLAEGCP